MPLAGPNRTRRARRLVVWAAAAALLCGLVAPPALADPTPAPPRGKNALAAAAPLQDYSSSLPRTTRDEITGDFLGRGYEQHMRAENSDLNIYDPPALGGELLRSTPLDLGPPTGAELWIRNQPGWIEPWAQYAQKGTLNCFRCFQAIDATYHLGSVYLAVAGGWLYISGTKGNAIDGGNNDTFPPAGNTTYRNLVYRVSPDGRCASEGCASKVADLPTHFQPGFPDDDRAIGVTALAAGSSGGNTFVAVGLTDFGVQVFKGDLSSQQTYAGMSTGRGDQTAASALAFDPSGSGMLAVGVVSIGINSWTVKVNPDGSLTGTQGYLKVAGTTSLVAYPLSVTFGRRSDGRLVGAWGYNNGSVLIGDPQTVSADALAQGTSPAGISVMNTLPRPDGSLPDDYAVAMQTTSDITGPLVGGMWRWTPGQSALVAQNVAVDANGNSVTAVLGRDAYRSWWPGFKQGRFTVRNNSEEQITVSLRARTNPGYGCWWAGTWADAGPFPDSGLTLAAGQTSTDYVMGAYTAGTDGKCAATDVTGEWRGYLVVTPVARPADARLVNLHLQRDWTLDVSDQTGGSTTVTAAKTGQLAALGGWEVTVDTPDAPTATAAPQVTPTVLTTTLRGRATVYRFDVKALKWTVPTAANPALQAVVPPLQVEGLSGTTWSALGYLMPITRLTGNGSSVTVGAGTFYWENTSAATYSQIRVRAGSGSGDPVSAPIVLSSLTAPTAPATALASITATPSANISPAQVAVPLANGVDQSTVTVQINTSTTTLPPTDAAYQSVYYRTGGNLITNLYADESFSTFVGVQPQPGAVIPQSRGSSTAFYDYVSTTSTDTQAVTANVGLGATRTSQAFTVDAVDLDLEGPGSGVAGTSGFSLEGCSTDFASSNSCRIANASTSAPALYQAGPDTIGLPVVGAQLTYQAFHAVSELPMEWQSGKDAANLSASQVSISGNQAQASFPADNFLPDDQVDITLVSHGQTTAVTVKVGGG